MLQNQDLQIHERKRTRPYKKTSYWIIPGETVGLNHTPASAISNVVKRRQAKCLYIRIL